MANRNISLFRHMTDTRNNQLKKYDERMMIKLCVETQMCRVFARVISLFTPVIRLLKRFLVIFSLMMKINDEHHRQV